MVVKGAGCKKNKVKIHLIMKRESIGKREKKGVKRIQVMGTFLRQRSGVSANVTALRER